MSRLGGWLRANVKPENHEAATLKERQELIDALSHTGLIMNDDIDSAYASLRKGTSSFHRLGAAVAFFIRSVLGMERSVMAETMDMLNECETKAWEDAKAAEKRGKRGDSIYPPGTEYELVKAETQLMGAVVGVLHESLMEAMKSFYKLRKAFITLDGIIQLEAKVVGEPSATKAFEGLNISGKTTPKESDSESEVFVDAKEEGSGPVTPAEQSTTSITTPETDDKLEPSVTVQPPKVMAEPELTFEDPVDVFIHSGANMCFGILMLILTLVPPSFARILSVVGFKGDRAKGVSMLWRSSTHDNINGAVAGMMLLAYYNGLLGTVDILPHPDDYDESAETVGPPKEKCDHLLAVMRERYPDSRLWQVEESRRLSSEHNLRGAIALLTSGKPSKMKQITALNDFELALDAMFVQDWNLMRDSFLRCAEGNDWSPALYWYMAGCATLEQYRDAVQAGDADEARRQKKKADAYLKKAPSFAGKKRFMASKLPFESFLLRRLQRWEERASELGIDMVDAVGVSPGMELCYMWNGTKRMSQEELVKAQENLSWDRCTGGEKAVSKMKSEEDELATWAVCLAAVRRRQGQYDEGKKLLDENVMKHDR